MKLPDKILSVSQERFNGLSLVISFVALLIAILVGFANGLPAWFKGQQATVYTPSQITLNQTYGIFNAAAPVTVINSGGSDINLRNVSIELQLEDGKKVELASNTWSETGFYYTSYFEPGTGALGNRRMTDVVVKPGNTWSGNVFLNEALSVERRETIEDVAAELAKESRGKLRRHQLESKELLTKLLTFMKSTNVAIEAKPMEINFLPCEAASQALVSRVVKLTNESIGRFVKGRHQLSITISTTTGTLHQQKYNVVVYERDIKNLRDPELQDVAVCVNADGNASTRAPSSSLRLELVEAGKVASR